MAKISPVIAYACTQENVILPDTVTHSRKSARDIKREGERIIKVRVTHIEGKA